MWNGNCQPKWNRNRGTPMFTERAWPLQIPESYNIANYRAIYYKQALKLHVIQFHA